MTRLTLTLLLAVGVGCNANKSSKKAESPSKESIQRAYAEYNACLILAGEDPDAMIVGEIYLSGLSDIALPPGGHLEVEISTADTLPLTVLNRARELDANQGDSECEP